MPTSYTGVLTIVVKPALQSQAEEMAVIADPEGGAGTFVPGVALRTAGDATNAVAAYWCRWNMTPEQQQRLVAEFGRRVGSLDIIAPGGTVRRNRNYWAFDSRDGAWNPGQVLTALGLAPLAPA